MRLERGDVGHQMSASLLVWMCVGALGCARAAAGEARPGDWKLIDAEGRFSFSLPSDMEPQPVRGIDSYVGEYRKNQLHLAFDYGWYSDPLSDSSEQEYEEAETDIDGRHGKLVTFRRAKPQDGFL